MNWTTRLPKPFTVEQPAQPAQPASPVFENEEALKLSFAAALLKSPNDSFKAALSIIDHSRNANNAMWVAMNWPSDSTVKAEMERLKSESDEFAFLPSKADIAREIYDLSNKEYLKQSDKLALEAKIAYAEIMGFVVKGSKVNVDAKNSNAAKVTIVASDLDEKL